ncbi:hypothetical protein LTS08_003107 [Lithohypha guttulata]|nr:hypothetical protein LTS08_003107 [Lithohypha guttulata]
MPKRPGRDAPPHVTVTSQLLTTQKSLLDTLSSFLRVLTHHLLYLRKIYPPVSFVTTRAYNFPVKQNRHPEVCSWIDAAVKAVKDEFYKTAVEKVAICIFECDSDRVVERWTIDFPNFPAVAFRDRFVPFASSDDVELKKKLNVTDIEASFRAVLLKLDQVSQKMAPLPDEDWAPDYSFTMTIEIKDGADAPVGVLGLKERKWIVAEPEFAPTQFLNDSNESDTRSEQPRGGTIPVRRLEAGELRMELWCEEAELKFKLPTTYQTILEKAGNLSYGAGHEKFNTGVKHPADDEEVQGDEKPPSNDKFDSFYDQLMRGELNNGWLEQPDINRKPQGNT